MRPASTYDVVVDGLADPTTVEVRPVHWLALERAGHGSTGTYEQLLRVIHVAGVMADQFDDDVDFDDWMATVVSWSKVDVSGEVDDDGPPVDQQPGTSPG